MWTIEQFESMYVRITADEAGRLERDSNPAKRKAAKSLQAILARWARNEHNPHKDHADMDVAAGCL